MLKRSVKKIRTHIENNEGILLVIGAEAFFAIMDVSVKLLGPGVSVLEILLARMIITYTCSVAYMYFTNINDPFLGPPNVRVLLSFRGFAGYKFFGIFGLYYSLQYLPLSDAIILTFLTPLCTAMSGSFLLKEKLGLKGALAGIVSFLGVVLIARPPFIFGSLDYHDELELRGIGIRSEDQVTSKQRLIAVGAGIIGALGATCEYTLIRVIGKRAHPLHNIMYLAILSAIVSAIGMLVTRTPIIIPTQWSFFGLFFLVGIFGMTAQTLMTMGYQREAIGRASMGVYTGIIFALILGKVVFGTVPGVTSVIGTVLILGSALYVAVTKEEKGSEGGSESVFNVGKGDADAEVGFLELDEIE